MDDLAERVTSLMEQLRSSDGEARDLISSVVQPIARVDDRAVIGYEALARVATFPCRGPDWWLAQAERTGDRPLLEAAFLRSAARLGPPPGNRLLFVNLSPGSLGTAPVQGLRSLLPDRLVVELTEQEAVEDYERVREALGAWLNDRSLLAIDDTGAGYSSLRHVIELCPDFLKIDRTLVQGIERDRNRQALVRALVAFAREAGTSVIAEGVETSREFETLRAAEVPLVQGYLLARPGTPWPGIDTVSHRATGRLDPLGPGGPALRSSLARARTTREACELVVQHLFSQRSLIPTVYLERDGLLRCAAQRGLWQVLDGMPPGTAVTGVCYDTRQAVIVEDVKKSSSYLEACPGVVAEICVPLIVDDRCVGALNVDCFSPLPSGTLAQLVACAALLTKRLATLPARPDDSSWRLAAHASAKISQAPADDHARERSYWVPCSTRQAWTAERW